MTHANRAEAKNAVRLAAFITPGGRQIVHRRGRVTGADVDLDEVLRDLDAAQEVTWGDDFMGYELAYVDAEGMAWRLAVRRPLDSDSMTEPYLDCPSCGTTIRAHMAPEVANVNPNDATVAHAEERYRQEIQELRRLRRQHQAALDLCDRADVHDPGHGHWISSNEIRAALGEPR